MSKDRIIYEHMEAFQSNNDFFQKTDTDKISNVDPIAIFNEFLTSKRIFKNKDVLSSSFVPEGIMHRNNEIATLSRIMAPSLLFEGISNVLVYGFSGTGKSLVTKFVAKKLASSAEEKKANVLPVYINCRLENNNTEYRLIANLCAVFNINVPESGLSVNSLYKRLVKTIDAESTYLILVLDEIEKLIQHAGDGVLYSLLRLNESLKHAKIAIIGISNNIDLKASLDQRVRSSLNPVEIIFRPYNADEIFDILLNRSKDAFYDNALNEGVLRKCAAMVAQEHGDIRKALDLLKVAGERTQQLGKSIITEEELDTAAESLEQNITEGMIKSMTRQSKCILLSIISVARTKRMGKVYSGEVYDAYLKLSDKFGLKSLTFRRVSDLIADMDYNSLVMSRIKSHGRYGRTRELNIAFSPSIINKAELIIKEELNLTN
ncbi:MAG: orc1/cdc6 family replication initiation protein [Candidatus Parvarchaeum acidiphilum ARMAN-4]|jgi:cell division control protein 6|uniref:ORC1-type DNA replication protein n=1 Tax=Candidatus Parvarchaeum acidiphilum ARMAN-4 TaxID=662760 RepID=D2EEW1_PARA4|nr:MAG: orc1/cdc6 family replication initiation protein [Candidatus Parvarchaeum acidiphilum ARMAN-4]